MADWEYVGASSVVESFANDITLTEPTGVAEGDLLVAFLAYRATTTTEFTLPTGWTLVGQIRYANISSGFGRSSGVLAYIQRGPTPPDLAFIRADGADVTLGQVVAYRGQLRDNPFDKLFVGESVAGSYYSASSGSSVTPSQGESLFVIGFAGGIAGDASNAVSVSTFATSGTGTNETGDPVPEQFLERSDTSTLNGGTTNLAIYDGIKTAVSGTGVITVDSDAYARHCFIGAVFRKDSADNLFAIEGPDTADIDGTVLVQGAADATEDGPDLFGPGTNLFIVNEIGSDTVTVTTPTYLKWNTLDKTAGVELTENGYRARSPLEDGGVRATDQIKGKTYFEIVLGDNSLGTGSFLGVADSGGTISDAIPISGPFVGVRYYAANTFEYRCGPSPSVAVDFTHTPTTGDVFGFAIDPIANKAYIALNGTWIAGDPATGVTPLGIPSSQGYTPTATGFQDSYLTIRSNSTTYLPPTGFALAQNDPALYGVISAAEAVGKDTAVAAGQVLIQGTVSATEVAPDAFVADGININDGSLAATEAGLDTSAMTGVVLIQGTIDISDTPDTFAGAGINIEDGSLAASEEGADTSAIDGIVFTGGDLDAVELYDADGFLAFESIRTGDVDATEQATDDFAATSRVLIQGDVDATEQYGLDTASATGKVIIAGTLAASDGADAFQAIGKVIISGSLIASDGADTLTFVGKVVVTGAMAATEGSPDTLASTGAIRPPVQRATLKAIASLSKTLTAQSVRTVSIGAIYRSR